LFDIGFANLFEVLSKFLPPFCSKGGAFNCASEAFLFFPMASKIKCHYNFLILQVIETCGSEFFWLNQGFENVGNVKVQWWGQWLESRRNFFLAWMTKLAFSSLDCKRAAQNNVRSFTSCASSGNVEIAISRACLESQNICGVKVFATIQCGMAYVKPRAIPLLMVL
jgi:hypothetical protein